MSFLNPMGLLGLIGIPILIIIYIIRPKYQEKFVSSTFIWKLSLKYKKKNVPLEWLKNTLLFLLQVLIITAISFILARPVLHSSDGSAEKIVIVDASASMMTEHDGTSYFNSAIEDIRDMAENIDADGKMTVIYAGIEASYIIEQSDSEYSVKNSLKKVSCSYGEADIEGAYELANKIIKENADAQVTLYTDKDYATSEDVKVVNLSEKTWNAAVLSLTASYDEDKMLLFTAETASYGTDISLTMALYVDNTYVDAQIVNLVDSESQKVVFDGLDINQYDKAQVTIEAADAIASDNEYILTGGNTAKYKVLVVSKESIFIETALNAMGNMEITTVKSFEELDKEPETEDATGDGTQVSEETEVIKSTGYDLYVYDGQLPDKMPSDGAIWVMNPPEDADSKLDGLLIDKAVEGKYTLSKAPNSETEVFSTLTEAITPENVAISKYASVSSYQGYEAVYMCNNEPVVLAGKINDIRTVVLAFDIHDTNLSLRIEYPELIYNMVKYSIPSVTDKRVYTVGESVHIEALSGVIYSNILSMNANASAAAQTYYSMPAEYVADAPGLYSISEMCADGTVRSYEYYVHLSTAESNIVADGGNMPTLATDCEKVSYDKDITWWLVLVLAALILIEWEVQYHEQF